ncbi:hypothetical protein U1Q18_044720 [Sarracenia purpurea var. burkii]
MYPGQVANQENEVKQWMAGCRRAAARHVGTFYLAMCMRPFYFVLLHSPQSICRNRRSGLLVVSALVSVLLYLTGKQAMCSSPIACLQDEPAASAPRRRAEAETTEIAAAPGSVENRTILSSRAGS